jgi:hypothetical protein
MEEQVKQLIKKLATLRTGEDEVPVLLEELFLIVRRDEWTEEHLS